MTTDDQRRAALLGANRNRALHTALKDQIRTGELSLRDLLLDPPTELTHYALIDVVRIARNVPRYRTPVWFQRMGRAASLEGVNLLIPLGRASERTRMWVADYAEWRLTGQGITSRRGVAA